LFGMLHLYQGSWGFVFTGSVALVYGLAFIAFGRNLWALILVHGAWNSLAILRIYGA
jgi:membrane protease YdiL (CAAX protease family)